MCRNCHDLNLRAETAFPSASKVENFILLLQLVFELELFKSPIGISGFWLGNPTTIPIASKICTKVVPYVPHLRSKLQVFTLSRFEVIAISVSGCRIRKFAQKKKQRNSAAKKRGSPS